MKHFRIFFAIILVLGFFSSCNDDNVYEKSIKPIVSTTQTSLTIAEGASASVTLNIDRPYKETCDLKIEVVGGTGSFKDFSVDGIQTTVDDGYGLLGYKLVFPAYASSFTFNINAVLDLLPEGTKTLKLKLSSAGNSNGLVAANSEYITLTILPTVSSDFVAIFDWSGSTTDANGVVSPGVYVGVDGANHEYCGFDFDLEFYDMTFNLLYESYLSCPEQITLDGATTPDGSYIIVPSFWSHVVPPGSIPASGEIIYPAFLTMSKPGAFVHTVDMTGQFSYSQTGATGNNPNAYIPVAIVTKTGNNYVVTDFNNGSLLAQGRMQSFLTAIKNRKHKK